MGALAIVTWIIALTGGIFFPPLFIVPIYTTYLWSKQRKQRKLIKTREAVARERIKSGNAVRDNQNSNTEIGVAEELTKLAELRDRKVITEAEFAAQKAKLITK